MILNSHGNALPEGYQLHWYRVGRVLGQGGFGITYEAFDTNLEKPVAIKEYLPGEFAVREADTTVRPFTEDRKQMFEWGLDRFLQEARTLARFHHPNIVLVHNVFEKNGTAYMVMQYEQGQALGQLFKFGRLESETDLLRIALPLIDGLEHMHEAGFIHRDIKPPNIYVRLDGSPVLLDFGSARFAIGGQTRTLTSLVTPGFAPYEQYNVETGKQGPWTDIYGLGATLYAGVNQGRGPIDAIVRGHARIEGKPDPMESAAELGKGRYSENFLNTIDVALGFTPEERPQSVAEWKRLFPSAEGNQPASTFRPHSQADILTVVDGDRQSAVQPRRRVIARWLSVGLIVAGISGAAYLLQTRLSTKTTPPEQQQIADAEQQRKVQQAVRRVLEKEVQPKRDEELVRLAREENALKDQKERERLASPMAKEKVPQEQERSQTVKEQAARRKQQRIDELLTEADEALTALRLTSPAGDNAMEYLRSVLKLDAENLRARQGIGRVVSRYLEIAGTAREQGEWGKAENYINKADAIEPGAEVILMAREQLVQKQTAAENERSRLVELERKRIEEEKKKAEESKHRAEKESVYQNAIPSALVSYGVTPKHPADYVSEKLNRSFKKTLIEMSIDEEIKLVVTAVDRNFFMGKQYLEKGTALCKSNQVAVIFGIFFDHWMGGKKGDLIMTGFDCTSKEYTKKTYNVKYDSAVFKWGPGWKKAIASFFSDTDIINKIRKTYKGKQL